MAERIVKKAKEYDRDTIPGDYATLATPCPNCGGVVKENYRRYACDGQGQRARWARVRVLDHQDPRRPRFRDRRGRGLPARQEGRPARGLPLQGRLALHGGAEARARRRDQQLETGVRLRRRPTRTRPTARRWTSARKTSLGACPEVPGTRLRAWQQLRLRAQRRRACDLRLQDRQDHPHASRCRTRKCTSCSPAARPRCSRILFPTRRGASSRLISPTTRRKAR